ncbi:MDIS1-interacting receptor like kinase 2-like [Pistacia vera]|uniref:MDIS1-interacting receptor like kinase 2-like n=1 Tax=Pistacia vera TaxID=55513 RepID=UPI001262B6DD|nr:MDIS1-interacting receptor like kinase 2-like [Pistacia vera]
MSSPNYPQLRFVDLSDNKLNGHIPIGINSCVELSSLNLSYNNLSGRIPLTIGGSSLSQLDLSNNNLSGIIPDSLSWELHYWVSSGAYLDLSYNNLEGPIPLHLQYLNPRLEGNKGLCGADYGFTSCYTPPPPSSFLIENDSEKKPQITSTRLITVILPITTILTILIFGFFFLKRKDKKAPLSTSTSTRASKIRDVFSIWNFDGRIAFEDLIEATEGFDIKYCIGTGGYGSVYKAQLPQGKVVALKKLHSLEIEESASLNSFQNEVRVLSELRHRNIIKLYGYCLHKKCMFLIYEYMERGSLFCVLRQKSQKDFDSAWARPIKWRFGYLQTYYI